MSANSGGTESRGTRKDIGNWSVRKKRNWKWKKMDNGKRMERKKELDTCRGREEVKLFPIKTIYFLRLLSNKYTSQEYIVLIFRIVLI